MNARPTTCRSTAWWRWTSRRSSDGTPWPRSPSSRRDGSRLSVSRGESSRIWGGGAPTRRGGRHPHQPGEQPALRTARPGHPRHGRRGGRGGGGGGCGHLYRPGDRGPTGHLRPREASSARVVRGSVQVASCRCISWRSGTVSLSGGGSGPSRTLRVTDPAKWLVMASALCSRLGPALLNIVAPPLMSR